jgi:hypothetical protein
MKPHYVVRFYEHMTAYRKENNVKEIESLLDRSNGQPVAPIYDHEAVYGPGRRLYHSVRADLLEKLAQERDLVGLRGLAGQYRMDAQRHRKLAGQLPMEEGEI